MPTGPAALVISEKQRAQIAGLKQAIDNSEKAVSLVQTAEGALNEINNLLVSIRGLALDSANSGVNDEDALAANQAEITNALETIDRIANNTQFGTKKLLDGSAGINGVVSDSDVTFLRATSDTSEGTHSVEVTTAGERATRNRHGTDNDPGSQRNSDDQRCEYHARIRLRRKLRSWIESMSSPAKLASRPKMIAEVRGSIRHSLGAQRRFP